MFMNRLRLPALAAVLLLAVAGTRSAAAQGVTTGAVTGTVTDSAGTPLDAAQIQLRNPLTGVNLGAQTRGGGTYLIQGVEPNDGYEITVRLIGFAPITRTGIRVTLGQARREDFRLARQATQLSEVTITATTDPVINASKTGTATTISDSALRRLPTLNRNFQDFVQLVPQVSTTTGYLSGGGANLRQNQIQIDGAQAGDVFGLGATGQPGAQANAKSIPLDAVKEYQVLLSPFDVRQGNFGGLLINAVTKSGTNEFHGSAYGYLRDQALTREQEYLQDFTQRQYGGTIGGPIIRDKAFFFLSGEIQQQEQPASGPFSGSSDNYVSDATIESLNQVLTQQYGFTGAGTGARVPRNNPSVNLFGRIDANLPFNTRLVLRHNYSDADTKSFSRSEGFGNSPLYRLTSNAYDFSSTTHSTVAQFLTNFTNGAYNELLVNRSTTEDFRTVPVTFPEVTVRGFPRSDNGSGTASLRFGTEASSQGNALDQRTFEITDNFTFPIGSHSLTLGTKNVFYKSINLFAQDRLGNWQFASLADLEAGRPTSYVVRSPAPTDPYEGLATIRANQHSIYLQDTWTATPTLTMNFGIRWDKPSFQNLPPENPVVFEEYGRHTSSVPSLAQWSPRFGFNWDVTGDQVNQLRGGVGAFTGGVPFVYLSNAFGGSGLSGFSQLSCNGGIPNATATTSFMPPAFNQAAIDTPPTSCASYTRPDGTVVPGATVSGPSSSAAVNSIDPDFKYPQYLKATLGYDRRIGSDWIATIEGFYSRSLQNAFYQNLALATGDNVHTDERGRVIYGSFTATGAREVNVGSRRQVLDLTNANGDYTWSVTGQLQKSFSNNFEGSVAYTYQQARDVVSITSSTAGSNFRYQRSVSGRLDDMSVTRSKYDQPHRIIATGTYRTPWAMDVSFIYSGSSGAPFDFVYGSNGGSTGDLNADGQTQNDLMYVPTDATNPSEILFADTDNATASEQAQAFEQFIRNTDCLNESRGRILERNACRNPWVNQVDISIAQSLGRFGGQMFQNLQVRLDVINFTNMLNEDWGAQAFSDQGETCGQICSATTLLTHVGNELPAGQTSSPTAKGIYTFNTGYQLFNAENASSNYRMQLSLRYSF
jgi:hypothetical protein